MSDKDCTDIQNATTTMAESDMLPRRKRYYALRHSAFPRRPLYAADAECTVVVVKFPEDPGPETKETLKKAGFRYAHVAPSEASTGHDAVVRPRFYWWAPYTAQSIGTARAIACVAACGELDGCVESACDEAMPFEPLGDSEFVQLRATYADQLRALGCNPESTGYPAVAKRLRLLRTLAASDLYDVPAEALMLAETGCMTAVEIVCVINAAYSTYQGIDREPKDFVVFDDSNPLVERRAASAQELKEAGFKVGSRRTLHLNEISGPREALLIMAMSRDAGFDVPKVYVDLACKGVLLRKEAEAIISELCRFRALRTLACIC